MEKTEDGIVRAAVVMSATEKTTFGEIDGSASPCVQALVGVCREALRTSYAGLFVARHANAVGDEMVGLAEQLRALVGHGLAADGA